MSDIPFALTVDVGAGKVLDDVTVMISVLPVDLPPLPSNSSSTPDSNSIPMFGSGVVQLLAMLWEEIQELCCVVFLECSYGDFDMSECDSHVPQHKFDDFRRSICLSL